MTRNDDRRGHGHASTILAVLAGIMLTAGGAAAQVEQAEEYESSFAEEDTELYGFYDAGFDEANENDNWFFDYYELGTDIDASAWTTSDDVVDADDDYELDYEWGDSEASELGTDDVGDEGLLDW